MDVTTITVRNLEERLVRGARLLAAERTKATDKNVAMNDIYLEAIKSYLESPMVLEEIQRGGYYK